MRILVTGGRDYGDRERVAQELGSRGPSMVAHGGARGADSLAGFWCRSNGVQDVVYEARWRVLGSAAGPIRNGKMLDDFKPDLVLAFPGGRGTADCVRQARAKGFDVCVVGDAQGDKS